VFTVIRKLVLKPAFALALASALNVMPVAAQNKTETMQYSRIVSAGGSITEIIFAFGLMPKVVAVDSSSLYPASAKELPQVGYFRNLGAEGLLSLSPDLIIAARGAGPSTTLDQVKSAGVTVKQFEQSVYTLASWGSLVSDMGAFFEKQSEAKQLINKVTSAIDQSKRQRLYGDNKLNAIALLNSGQRGQTLAGKNTVADLLLSTAGINNLGAEFEGYKPFSAEMLANAQVDMILVPQHNLESMGGIEGICAQVAIKLATKKGCHVHAMDPLLLLGFGSRLDQAVEQVVDQGNAVSKM